ncbi:hypothetical protein LJY25_17645 [Hymenobacter sp. BT175]|uniref:hypothetical protein n=1 Tax=Hymenobacter translucens TaxID=2886507 RepID=UPI001D0EB52C|nr:hypothetical protein [Hymenobacter translucens]MCC2548278.1 hypothetical protein [Hymenobacter translucens]
MKKLSSLPLLLALTLALTACNKDSYLEGVAPAPTGGTAGANTGKITFYCLNPRLDNCGNLTVYIDSNYKGDLNDRTSSAPACGSNSATALTVTLPAGSHSYSISSTSSNCLRYSGTITVTKGSCDRQGLN